jgi:excisionase family DNA binding protein
MTVLTDAPLMSVSEYARHLNVSEVSVRRWARDGLIPAEKVGPGRLWRIDGDARLPTLPNSARGDHPDSRRIR